jgi:hypothetical protein
MEVVRSSDINLDQTTGDVALIRKIADGLKRSSPDETLEEIHRYLRQNLKEIHPAFWNHAGRGRKTSTEIMRDGAWGCSAHAQVACHLARACKIPAILLKSLNVSWIEHENKGDGHGSGHVYVEVFIDGKPCLWDAQGGTLDKRYDATSRHTPDGKRVIYEKGGPDALILSHHGFEWEAETRRLFPVRT